MQNKKKKLIAVLFLAAAAVLIFLYAKYYKRPGSPPLVSTTGVVEALETDVSAKIAGKLKAVYHREGEAVKAGELLATLESEDLEAQSAQAQASLGAAKAALSGGIDQARSAEAALTAAKAQVESQKAAVSGAAARLTKAESDLVRAKELFKRGVIAKSDLDVAQTARDTAQADIDAAKSFLAAAKASVDAADANRAKARSDIAALQAAVKQAQAQVEFQKATLGYTRIYSPVDAVVEYRSLEPGEVVAPGTSILTLIDPKSLWVRIDLEEGDVARVKAGQKAEITLERMPGKVIDGVVYDIGREGEFAVERDVTRGRQDIKTFRTRIRVTDPEGILKPGMTVLVTIPQQLRYSIKIGPPT